MLIVQTLLTLVNSSEGAKAFVSVEDVSPLIEIAPSQSLALDVFLHAYAQCAISLEDRTYLQPKIDQTVAALVVTFKGTDGVTLLNFLDQLLRRLDSEVCPSNFAQSLGRHILTSEQTTLASPAWLEQVIVFIRKLVMSKPTPAGRTAYINLTASLLQIYPAGTTRLLFSNGAGSEKPFFYLLINLVLVDLRSSFPALLEQLNTHQYESISRRLASAFDIVSAFLGFLVRFLDDEDAEDLYSSILLSPDLLLKLRTSISETMSLAIEYLRDRWDASVAGAMGLHPEARTGTAKTSSGSHYTLAWDSKTDQAYQDPLILSAIRTLAIWLREDDNDTLRKEASGLSDMLLDLYKTSSSSPLDFRRAVLVALEGIITVDKGAAAFLENEGWEILTRDMLAILQASSCVNEEDEAARGIEIVRVLLPVVEREQPGSRETWLAVVTAVAAWDVPNIEQAPVVLEFQVAVLQLATALLSNTHAGMQKRYVHSISAVIGIAGQLKGKVRDDAVLEESLEDVESTLGPLR